MGANILEGDILAWAEAYDGPPFHALLCDPPYHLTEITKRFGKADAAPAQYGTDGAFQRAARGFMGKTWDGGDVAFRAETWASLARHLYPGAFGMAFAGSRGWHRMAVAIEDAGLIIHPTIFGYSYGSGFPKATRIRGCTCGTSEPAAKYYMPGMRDPDVPPAGTDEGGIGAVLQPGLSEQSAPGHGSLSSEGPQGGGQSGLEGRSNEPAREGELCRGALRALPSGLPGDGQGGRLRDGASASDGPAGGETTGPGGGSPPPGPQPAKQRARKPRVVAGQSKPQAGGVGAYCDRCGLPIVDRWEGHRYGLQAMKPAIEPIIVFQKPYQGSPVECITETGAGALWIDGGRVEGGGDHPGRDGHPSATRRYTDKGVTSFAPLPGPRGGDPAGRWPANLVLLHAPGCSPAGCAEGCAVARLGAWSGEGSSKASMRGLQQRHDVAVPLSVARPKPGTNTMRGHDDSGTAARFFFQADYTLDRLEAADAVAYVAKASAAEREAGLDPVQVALVRELYGDDLPDFDMTTVDDGRETPIDNAYQRGETTRRNIHPTLKPLTLTRWLATLLLPPAEYGPRRLLVPFAGTGSELIGAMLAGWEAPTGIELDAQHVAIAQARIRYWSQVAHKFDRGQAIKVRAPKRPKRGAERTLWDQEDAA